MTNQMKGHREIVAAVVASALLSALASRPAAGGAPGDPPDPARRAGGRALVFSVGPNFTLDRFEGAALSYRLHRSAGMAWRFGLSLDGFLQEQDDHRESVQQDTIRHTSKFTVERRNLHCGLSATMLRYAKPDGRLSPYYGFGPTLDLSWSRDENDARGRRVDNTHAQRALLGGLVGLEWLFQPRLALHAEYGLSGGFVWSHQRYRRVTEPPEPDRPLVFDRGHQNRNGWRLEPVSGRLGLSAFY